MPSNALITPAHQIGNAFYSDTELQLPVRPYLRKEMLVLPYEDSGVLVAGCRELQLFRGRSARMLLPRLFPILNGEHTFEEICLNLPDMMPRDIFSALALLYSRGVLEDGVTTDIPAALQEAASFYGRFTDVTRVNKNRAEALGRLQHAHIGIAASHTTQAEFRSLFCSAGVNASSALHKDVLPSHLTFIVAFTDHGHWAAAASILGIPVLRVRMGESELHVGPLYVPGSSACFQCFNDLHGSEPQNIDYEPPSFYAGLVAMQVLHLISRIAPTRLYNRCVIYGGAGTWESTSERLSARLPGCELCGLQQYKRPQDLAKLNPWLLHTAGLAPPFQFGNPKEYQSHYSAANIALTKDTADAFEGCRSLSLSDQNSNNEASPSPLDLRALSEALRVSFGNKVLPPEARRMRCAPSAGGLGSATATVVVRDLPGVQPGVYRYDSQGHALRYIGFVTDSLLAGALNIVESKLTSVLLFIVSDLGRFSEKYGNSSVRLVSGDAGVSLEYLRLSLQARNVPVQECPEYSDHSALEALLLPTIGNRYLLSAALLLGVIPDISERYHAGIHIVSLMAGEVSGSRVPSVRQQVRAGDSSSLRKSKLDEVMAERHSLRSYGATPLSLEQVTAVVAAASSAHLDRIKNGGLSLALQFWVVVNRQGRNLPTGVYCFDSLENSIVKATSTDPGQAAPAVMQASLANAPVLLMVTGDMSEALQSYGGRGYRDLISHAGTGLAGAILAATRRNIQGCFWGGFYEDGWGSLLDSDRYGRCPLLGLSLGFPIEEPLTSSS